MEEAQNFAEKLEVAITKKQEWFDTVQLPSTLESYRLMYVCVKTINENLVKRQIIIPDPYKLDSKISEIVVPPGSAFTEQDLPRVIGERLSSYEMMIDFLCNYYRFTIENLSIPKIKTLIELNKCFLWEDLTVSNGNPNTQGLASAISDVKTNAPAIVISMINDSVEKCVSSSAIITKNLAELSNFQRENYKFKIRKQVIENSDFNKETAYSSMENEVAEIKRLFGKVFGKTPFYSDLVAEIASEDQADDKERLQEKVLAKLGIKSVETKPKKTGPNSKDLLMNSIMALGGIAPVLSQLYVKLDENFALLFFVKKTFFRKIIIALRKKMNIPEKERVCTIPIIDQKTGNKIMQKVKVNSLLEEVDNKKRIYSGFASKGAEYNKVFAASETAILTYVNKQISENQNLFTVINALDDYFKSNVEILLRPKVKGLKIDLSSYRNVIITVNKKRGEYVSLKEEMEQIRKLGMVNNGKNGK